MTQPQGQRPILFHDIDGVLFGEYEGAFQLRPGVTTWLEWAHEHFEVLWLTSWSIDRLRSLLSALYCEKFVQLDGRQILHHANWTNCANKAVWLSSAIQKLEGREWYWIDDDIENLREELRQAQVPVERCVYVNPTGREELSIVKATLSAKIALPVPPRQAA